MKEKMFKLLVLPSVSNTKQVVEMFPFPIKLTRGKYKSLEFIFHDGKMSILHDGTDLRDFSFVWLSSSWRSRDLAYAVQLYLDRNKIPNTIVEKGTSKLTDQVAFSLFGIQTPNTLFIGNKDVANHLEQIKRVCGYPLIVKDIKGSRGTSSMKAENEDELLEKMKKLPKYKKFMFQQFISNDYDWGIMVANGEVVSGEKSYPCTGEFRNNACNGAKEVFVDPELIPDHIKETAIEASKLLGLQWSRSDILIDKNTQQPYVLEVNRLPGITAKTSEVAGAYAFLSAKIAPFVGNVIEKEPEASKLLLKKDNPAENARFC